jgi:hypothetical protein
MISVDVTIQDNITKDIKRIKQELAKVPRDAELQFVALTPIRSGNARRNTNLVGNQIQANYPYAQRLDEGWSKQAPRGITRPWEAWFRKRIKQIMGK